MFAVIVDNLRVRKWQADALASLSDSADFLVLNCTNTHSPRDLFNHSFYYFLNLLSLKSAQTRRQRLPSQLRIASTINFEAIDDGKWQKLPPGVLETIAELKPQVIVKFGMGLLRVPENLNAQILSYHHGDPRHYRGRPAGFYELLNSEPVIGQVVQIISNSLDAGAIVAFGQTRVHSNSYSATMIEAYRASKLLLPAAIRRAVQRQPLPLEAAGRNYRLPANPTVARFAARLLTSKIRRWIYSLFFEKAWRVAQAPIGSRTAEDLLDQFPPESEWKQVELPRQYRFLADPFPFPGGMLVEALRRRDDRGEILRIDSTGSAILCSDRGHFSYPATLSLDAKTYLLPEVSGWSSPILYEAEQSSVTKVAELTIRGGPKLKDATAYVAHDRKVFLFANKDGEGPGVLRLWVAPELFGEFVEHPMSPIRISPAGSRMAGAVFSAGKRLFRIGQDCSRDYGNGALLFEISEISESRYSERHLGDYRFGGVKGPHTINIADGKVMFDFYRDEFSATAGLRRLRAYLRTWFG